MMTPSRSVRQRPTPKGRGRTPRSAGPSPKPARARTTAVWAGLDVGKSTFEAALAFYPLAEVIDNPLEGMPGQGFNRTREEAVRFLVWARGFVPRGARLVVLMEATGRYSRELAVWLCEADSALDVIIGDPYKINRYAESLGTRSRNDKVDARMIARFGAERTPRPRPPSAPEYERLRELTRERRRVIEERVRLENRMSEGTPLAEIEDQWKQERDLLRRHEQALDAEIEKVVQESETIRRDTKAMQALPGIGPVITSTLQGEAGDPRRFATARSLVAFCGLSPEVKESGTSVHRSRPSKRGSPKLRQVLYMGAMAAIRAKRPNRFQAYYKRRIEQGLGGKAALRSVQRKMLTSIYCVTTREQAYDDRHQPNWNPRKKEKKTARKC